MKEAEYKAAELFNMLQTVGISGASELFNTLQTISEVTGVEPYTILKSARTVEVLDAL